MRRSGSPPLWVSKSLDKRASALADTGPAISPDSVRRLLIELGFSRQANRKTSEGASHPDRNAQFQHINGRLAAAQAAGEPVVLGHCLDDDRPGPTSDA